MNEYKMRFKGHSVTHTDQYRFNNRNFSLNGRVEKRGINQ